MVECTALEMRRAFTGTVGSNPTLSATGLFAASPRLLRSSRPPTAAASWRYAGGANFTLCGVLMRPAYRASPTIMSMVGRDSASIRSTVAEKVSSLSGFT